MVFGLDRYVAPGLPEENSRGTSVGAPPARHMYVPRHISRAIADECRIPRETEKGVGSDFNWTTAMSNNWQRVVAMQRSAGLGEPHADYANMNAPTTSVGEKVTFPVPHRTSQDASRRRTAYHRALEVMGDQQMYDRAVQRRAMLDRYASPLERALNESNSVRARSAPPRTRDNNKDAVDQWHSSGPDGPISWLDRLATDSPSKYYRESLDLTAEHVARPGNGKTRDANGRFRMVRPPPCMYPWRQHVSLLSAATCALPCACLQVIPFKAGHIGLERFQRGLPPGYAGFSPQHSETPYRAPKLF